MGRLILVALLACVGHTLGQRYGGGGSSLSCQCKNDYIPFCATDGRREITFSNKCALECAQRSNPGLRIKFEGVCAKPYVPEGGKSSTGGSKIIGGTFNNNDLYGSSSQQIPSYSPTPRPNYGSGSVYPRPTSRPNYGSGSYYPVTTYRTTRRPFTTTRRPFTTTRRSYYPFESSTTRRPSYGTGSGIWGNQNYVTSTLRTTTSLPWWQKGYGQSQNQGFNNAIDEGRGYGQSPRRYQRQTEDDDDNDDNADLTEEDDDNDDDL